VGKAEGQGKVQKGYLCLQEIHWSQADESSFEEEIVGDDEGTVGGEKEGDLNPITRQDGQPLPQPFLNAHFIDPETT
jgi:hypothetical protein